MASNKDLTADILALDEKAELEGKIVIGVLVDREIPTYHEKYRKLFHEKVKA